MSTEKLLGVKEVQGRLGISRTTLYHLMEEGKIKPIEKASYLKKPAKLQFRESDVEKLLQGEPENTENDAA
jgi:predicted site-specific integrase-resolvase